MNAKVSFGKFQEAWQGFFWAVRGLIEANNLKRVCDVGGGANPVLPSDYLDAKGIDYTILDISADELAKAPPGYRRVQADICARDLADLGGFDLIFTKMLAEHVVDGQVFHQNVLRLLSRGGIAFHFFPTLYAPPFVANRLLPERLTHTLLDIFSPRDKVKQGKFPAYYSWCRGPTSSQIERLEALGYEILEYRGFYGHSYYKKLPPLHAACNAATEFLLKHPLPQLTTFAYLTMRKP
jgi:SAM-dependent methyltransferase